MGKFKVGDKVRVLQGEEFATFEASMVGKEGVINSIEEDFEWPFGVLFQDHKNVEALYLESELELVNDE